MNYYIGLDAHSQTCTAVVVDESGDQKLRETFETTEANLVGFVNKINLFGGDRALAQDGPSASRPGRPVAYKQINFKI